MRRLILLSTLALTACPLPYCPVHPITPGAHKAHTRAPQDATFSHQKQSAPKKPEGSLLRMQNQCLTVQNSLLVRQPCRNTPNQYFERDIRSGTIRQSGQCLTQSGSRITLAPCHGQTSQQWYGDDDRLCSRSANAQCWDAAERIILLQTRSNAPSQEVR
ncbi:ricin-type beta-trefoil lectin domain protein [Eikenella sp. S3360]|uniref:Ricin-type beta-trefoil lectin domain protein n=1 Tax=Eikenella glucosivorans TaxID=2766967 RepID=A0ABS0N906_9NEIS|nr:ricin-type beta-trefoil lectin domain protein [Eikenella glucosivorans]MBH5328757.1 ricin-type beta-trefoil lectin domain protein [Eikenella glucosivorans]